MYTVTALNDTRVPIINLSMKAIDGTIKLESVTQPPKPTRGFIRAALKRNPRESWGIVRRQRRK
jgi:hypothetical protein